MSEQNLLDRMRHVADCGTNSYRDFCAVGEGINEIKRLQAAFKQFVECAATVRRTNQTEWLEYFTRELNTAATALGEDVRFEFDGDCFRIVSTDTGHN